MKELIEQRLAKVERDRNVRILYACESGSRTWGFASTNSDWDVRFLYVQPKEVYLSVFERRDVIELPIEGDLDISGWDLRKTLRLLRKSNPALLEWISAPIVYRQDEHFLAQFRRLAARFYSPAACFHHYLQMARGNYYDYLRGEQVRLKKYLYVLRPVLACQWIEQEKGHPPVVFGELVKAQVEDAAVRSAIENLLERKRSGAEMDEGPRDPVLHAFLDAELTRLQARRSMLPKSEADTAELDEFFRHIVGLIEVMADSPDAASRRHDAALT